jgi:hypothetical protein
VAESVHLLRLKLSGNTRTVAVHKSNFGFSLVVDVA